MRIELAGDQRLFAWRSSEFCQLVAAKDEDEAYRKVIAARLRMACFKDEETEAARVEQARRWFRHNDSLDEIDVDGLVEDAPFEGDLPDDDSDGAPF